MSLKHVGAGTEKHSSALAVSFRLLWSPCNLLALLCNADQVHGLMEGKPVQETCAQQYMPRSWISYDPRTNIQLVSTDRSAQGTARHHEWYIRTCSLAVGQVPHSGQHFLGQT